MLTVTRVLLGVGFVERVSAVGVFAVAAGVFASADAVGGVLALLCLVGKYLGVLAAALSVGVRGGVVVHGGGWLFGARGLCSECGFRFGDDRGFGSVCGDCAHGIYATVCASLMLANSHVLGRNDSIR